MAEKIEVTFVSGTAGGMVETVDIDGGMTAGELFYQEMGEAYDDGRYRLRVNGDVVSRSYVLNDGDRLTVGAMNIKGN